MTDEELLTPHEPEQNNGLREALLGQTALRVRRAHLLRLAGRAALCVACFGAGLATTLMRPTPEPEIVYVVQREIPVTNAPGSAEPMVNLRSPAEMELEAEQIVVKPEAARRFREAGDRYFRDFADYRAALRCYRNFLDEADPAELQVTPDDTWLLTSLKRAREQEHSQ
jgi:hypothetical protein